MLWHEHFLHSILTPQRRMPSSSHHDVITTCHGVLSCAHILHCLTFSSVCQIHMKLLHFSLSSLINKTASFNVICITNLLDQVLLLFSQCKYEVIYQSSLHAYTF
jgi:hypothetical protein